MPSEQIAFPWAGFILFAIANCFTPGPNNLMSLANGSRFGWKRNMPFSLGVGTAVACFLLLCTWFCSLLNIFISDALVIMKFLGAVYILYLAFKTLLSSKDLEQKESRLGYWTAISLQVINPKIWLYCILVVETYLLQYYEPDPLLFLPQLLVLVILPIISNMLWSLCGNLFSLVFSRHKKAVNIVVFLLLAYCAVSLFI